jgi:UPF0042 nucleotide-binding protein
MSKLAEKHHILVLVTGPSGAGRSTAIKALEDIGFETIDNLPLSLLPRLYEGQPLDRPTAVGIDVRNRDFSAEGLIEAVEAATRNPTVQTQVVFLDCRTEILQRRYSETRRRHPLSPDGTLQEGIEAEAHLLGPLRAHSDILIDTSDMTPHNLRAEMARLFAPEGGPTFTVTVESFSYKRGVPRGADMVLDCRFLANPHWDANLRARDGRDTEVAEYVRADARFDDFIDHTVRMLEFLLPAYVEEGKSHFTLSLGCTGGQHRSVFLAETLANALADKGWQVSKRHREIDRRGEGPPGSAPEK